MKIKKKIIEPISMFFGGFAGAKAGSFIASSLLSGAEIYSNYIWIPVEFACSLTGSGIGAFVGKKAGKEAEKICSNTTKRRKQ